MKFSDITGVIHTSVGKIIEVSNPFKDYYVVKIKPKDGLTWIAGEHGIFSFPKAKFKGRKWRAFSIASIPEDGYMLLGTRTGATPSTFKSHLMSLKTDDPIHIRGPFGWFKLQANEDPMVLFAGGVGITPILALLKALDGNDKRPVHIVYAASDYYLFKDTIDDIASRNENIRITYTKTPDETIKVLNELSMQYKNDAYYYQSGSSASIKSVKQFLRKSGIKRKRMINDLFLGY